MATTDNASVWNIPTLIVTIEKHLLAKEYKVRGGILVLIKCNTSVNFKKCELCQKIFNIASLK